MTNTSNGAFRKHGAAFLICVATTLAPPAVEGAAGMEPPSPFTRIFDTSRPANLPLEPSALKKRTNWVLVPEGKIDHAFNGDAVLQNDRLTVLLRRQGTGARVYAQGARGSTRRALVTPAPDRKPEKTPPRVRLTGISIKENETGAVAIGAVFRTEAGAATSTVFRITTGSITLELLPGYTGTMRLEGHMRHLVVPDYFGDDTVLPTGNPSIRKLPDTRIGIPAENRFLALLEGGDAMIMCLWQTPDLNADCYIAADGTPGHVSVECEPKKRLWLAFLESPRLWHHARLPAAPSSPLELNWTAPYPARWRATFFTPGGRTDSWHFADTDEPDRLAAGRGKGVSPCTFRKGRAVIHPQGERGRARLEGQVVIYPIDRSRSTPLTVFCPIDVCRNTLGVGPCQYILEAEGLGEGAPVTAAAVTHWIERQIKRKRAHRLADPINARLDQMMRHMTMTLQRIVVYEQKIEDIRRHLAAAARDPGEEKAARRLLAALDDRQRIDARSLATGLETVRKDTAASRELLAAPDAQARFHEAARSIRAYGARQEYTLARCRATARRLRQECRMLPGTPPETAALRDAMLASAGRLLHLQRPPSERKE